MENRGAITDGVERSQPGVKRVPSKGTSTWPSCRVTGLPRAWIQIGYPGVAQIGAAKLKKFCRITGDGNERLRGLDR
jgi:hypothetical protein